MPTETPEAAAISWWGTGEPPHERWPGVTIQVDGCDGKYYFNEILAGRVCDFFPKYCSHAKGEFSGQKFDLLDYQAQLILRPLFGWVRVSDGTRRFRKAYIEIPKKNGKTQLIAGLALYTLLADSEPGAEVYVAAADRDQARILFSAAKAMVEASPALTKRLQVYQNYIARKDDSSAFFKVLSAEAATKHGPNIHCLIMDELHAQPDRDLFETLTRGVIARRQPLILLITTAGDDDESICYEERDYALGVLKGTIPDEQHLPVIFEADPSDDWLSPEVWRRVNPGLGHTIQEEAIAAFAQEAAHEPRKRNDFLRYHLNRWVNQATAWIPVEWWDACHKAEPMPSDAELQGWQCAGGLDLAQKIDIAAFVVLFRRVLNSVSDTIDVSDKHAETGDVVTKTVALNYELALVPYFWIPEATMREHEKKDGVPYSLWVEQGLVTATEGDVIDYTRIYQDITTKIVPRFPLLKQGFIGYDPAFATDIASRLESPGGFKVVEVLQNYTHLSEPSYVMEALIKARRVRHSGHRILRNHVENVAVKKDDAARIRPVKPKRQSKRIDGLVASLIGLRTLLAMPLEPMQYPVMVYGGRK